MLENKFRKYKVGKTGPAPQIGIVGSLQKGGSKYVLTYGNDIPGDLAAIKRLVNARTLFLTKNSLAESYGVPANIYVSLIDDLDVLSVGIADVLNNNKNRNYIKFNRNTTAFRRVVERILNDNNFEASIKTVKTINDNTTLRMENVNTDFSSSYKDAILNNPRPVILAHGLWSDLFSWKQFGKELAFDPNNARDTWLIELTGGSTTECVNCPNYTYNDLVNFYWPALVSGVLKYSGQNASDYVGFDNGCRVALSSLQNWSSTGKTNAGYFFNITTGQYVLTDLPPQPVKNLVVLGCLWNFSGDSPTGGVLSSNGAKFALKTLQSLGDNHIRFSRFFGWLLVYSPFVDPIDLTKFIFAYGSDPNAKSKISLALLSNYVNFTKEQPPIQSINVTNFTVVRGVSDLLDDVIMVGTVLFGIPGSGSDFVVSKEDTDALYESINSGDKMQIWLPVPHSYLADGGKSFAKNRLAGRQLNPIQKLFQEKP